MSYTPGSNWTLTADSFKEKHPWIVGLLFFKEPQRIGLYGLHITVSRPSRAGWYSDLHVTFEYSADKDDKDHIYYQITNGKPVTFYSLATKDLKKKDALWIAYCDVKDTTEREMIPFATYCGSLNHTDRGYAPGTSDPKDTGERKGDWALVSRR